MHQGKQPRKISLTIGIVWLTFSLVMAYASSSNAAKTPSDIYDLTLSIDSSIVSVFNLKTAFDKERVATDLKPRNVFNKGLQILKVFDQVNIGSIDKNRISDFERISEKEVGAEDIYQLMELMKNALSKDGNFTEIAGDEGPWSYSDVFEIMRRLYFHVENIAKMKQGKIFYGGSAQVYEKSLYNVLLPLNKIARDNGIPVQEFHFPGTPLKDALPRYVFKLQESIYENLTGLFKAKSDYQAVKFLPILKLDEITPVDVMDVTTILMTEIDEHVGSVSVSPELSAKFDKWKTGRTIVPGDVFHLVVHNFSLSRLIADQYRK